MKLSTHATLHEPWPESALLAVSVTPDNEAVALWSRPGHVDTWTTTIQSASEVTHRIDVPAHEWRSPLVQAMPEGGILIANAECAWRPGGPDENAEVVAPDGSIVCRGTLGDGIGHLLTTSAGDIWVGYTDTGIYGNRGWGDPGGPRPIGHAGLLRFGPELNESWSYGFDNGDFVISDVEALNVTDSEVVASIYGDEAIVRVADGQKEYWATGLMGVEGVVVEGDEFALIGGLPGEADRIVRGTLLGGGIKNETTSSLIGFHRKRQSSQGVVCRGPELHVFDEGMWSRATLD